jgi:hypothetical protein
MRDWPGIRADTEITKEDGALYLVNPSLYTSGELKRRDGMSQFTAQSGVVLTNFWSPLSGQQVVFATSTGSVIALAAP